MESQILNLFIRNKRHFRCPPNSGKLSTLRTLVGPVLAFWQSKIQTNIEFELCEKKIEKSEKFMCIVDLEEFL